jgi:hypothetical protein
MDVTLAMKCRYAALGYLPDDRFCDFAGIKNEPIDTVPAHLVALSSTQILGFLLRQSCSGSLLLYRTSK